MPAFTEKTLSEEFVRKHSYIVQKIWTNLNAASWLGKGVIECLSVHFHF